MRLHPAGRLDDGAMSTTVQSDVYDLPQEYKDFRDTIRAFEGDDVVL